MPLISYAQNAEDVLLWRALRDVQDGFYIDVGANDPQEGSLTKLFYDAGWHGINIEPMPSYRDVFLRDRPRDINLALACGAAEGSITLFDTPDVNGWASTDANTASAHRAEGVAVVETEVPMRTLSSICAEHAPGAIHFLKIDVEGFEGEVLRGMDLRRWRPWILVIEATLPNSTVSNHEQWEHLVTPCGYQFAYFDGLNRYYVADEQAHLLPALTVPPNVFDQYVSHYLAEAWRAIEDLQGELERTATTSAAVLQEQQRAAAAALQEKELATVAVLQERELATAAALQERELATAAALQEKDLAMATALQEKDLATAAVLQEKDLAMDAALQEKDLAMNAALQEKELATAAALHQQAQAAASALELQAQASAAALELQKQAAALELQKQAAALELQKQASTTELELQKQADAAALELQKQEAAAALELQKQAAALELQKQAAAAAATLRLQKQAAASTLLEQIEAVTATLQAQVDAGEVSRRELAAWAQGMEASLQEVAASLSWRLTRPLRYVQRLAHTYGRPANLSATLRARYRDTLMALAKVTPVRRVAFAVLRRVPGLEKRFLAWYADVRGSSAEIATPGVPPEWYHLPQSARSVLADLERPQSFSDR